MNTRSPRAPRTLVGAAMQPTLTALGTLVGAAMQPTLAALGTSSLDASVLRSAGIGPSSLAWDRRLPTARTDQLWQAATHSAGDAFSLRVASKVTPQSYGHLTYLLSTCATLGYCLRALVRYYGLLGNGTSHHLGTSSRSVRLSVETHGVRPACVERFAVAVVGCFLRNQAGATIQRAMWTQDASADVVAEASTVLGCPVKTQASVSGLEFDTDALGRPLRSADPQLRKLLEAHAQWALASEHSLSERVRDLFAAHGVHPRLNTAEIAHAAGMSERSLRRGLAAEGQSFRGLLDGALQAEAALLLRETSVEDVAATLGYSDAAAFRRAHRRWHGASPRAAKAASRSHSSRSRRPSHHR